MIAGDSGRFGKIDCEVEILNKDLSSVDKEWWWL